MDDFNNFKLLAVLNTLPFNCYYVPLFDRNGKTLMAPAFSCLPNLKLCLNESTAKIVQCPWCKSQIKYKKLRKVQILEIKEGCGQQFLRVWADKIQSNRCQVVKLAIKQVFPILSQLEISNIKEQFQSDPHVLSYIRSLKLASAGCWLSPPPSSDFKLQVQVIRSVLLEQQKLIIDYDFTKQSIQIFQIALKNSLKFRRGRWISLQTESSWVLIEAFNHNLQSNISRRGEGWLALDQNYYYVISQAPHSGYFLQICAYDSVEKYSQKIVVDIKKPDRAVLVCPSSGLTFITLYKRTILFKNINDQGCSELLIPEESMVSFESQGISIEIEGSKYWTDWQTAGQLGKGMRNTVPLAGLQS